MKTKSIKRLKALLVVLIMISSLLINYVGSVHALDSDYFGVSDHPEWYANYLDHCDQMIASGVKWVRFAAEWRKIETAKGIYDTNFLAKFDAIINRLNDNGVNVVLILVNTPTWASSMPNEPYPQKYTPANYQDWSNYVSFITNRYKGKVKSWEVWNEPDWATFWGSSVDDYNTLLQTAYTAIKTTDSSNTVVLGGLAVANSSYGLNSWFDTLMSKGAGSYFDVINYHAYGDSNRINKLYNGMSDIINKYSGSLGNKNIWITETGYTSSGDNIKESFKANFVDETYTLHKRYPKVSRIFYYNYRGKVTGNLPEDNFALVKNDFTPLKALSYYQASGGAATDFNIQQNYPLLSVNKLTLSYIKPSTGDGSAIVYENGSMRIPSTTYMYMKVDDNWLLDTNYTINTNVYIDVTYMDSGTSPWCLHYDGQSNIYTSTENITKTNSGTWKTQTFTLNNIKFANRQNNGADFRLYSNDGDLVVSKIVVRKTGNIAACVLRSTDVFSLIKRISSDVNSDQTYNPVTTIGGMECRQIIDNAHKMYFNVSEALMKTGDTNAVIGFTYWDSGTDRIQIDYNATGNNYKSVYVTKTNSNQWKYKEIGLTDANFINAQTYGADFRIGNANDGSAEYVNKVLVKKP